jgi:tetratricopeptide (TPR) repeat protein
MSKNKGKFGKGKSAVEPADEFVSAIDRVARRLRPHAVRIGVMLAVIAVAIIAYGAWTWFGDRRNAGATSLFEEAVEIASARIVPKDEASPTDDSAAPSPGSPAGPPATYGSTQERGTAVIAALDRLASEYDSSKVGREARLLRASTLLELGRHDEAAAAYDEYASDGSVDMLRQVAREGVGYALEAKALANKDPKQQHAGLEEALAAFASIQSGDEGPRRDVALYHQGRILAMLERQPEAIEKYKLALAVPNTALKPQIEYRLAELESKAKR